jgi:hypothetical protein
METKYIKCVCGEYIPRECQAGGDYCGRCEHVCKVTDDIRVSTIRTRDGYKPRITIYENNRRLYSYTVAGDPLVSRADALKYGNIERNELLTKNNLII